ncbi:MULTISPECIES: hypothetical protein [Paenibacillus]|uniref:hypothetical protein n=1 Tax=Paenibacillus TaxID=44249 RepID=UPI0022B88156|nr:hypothetical protein [Paenibacillus caseinilyticus]MCZ8522589.1 hypothetical protein [Paenibacillus caseinilyticus]
MSDKPLVKIPVHFRKTNPTAHLFQRLQLCRKCGRYSCLWHEHCLSCGAQGTRTPVEQAARTVMKRGLQTDLLILAALGLAAFAAAGSFEEMTAALAGALLLIGVRYGLGRRFEPYIYRRTLHRLLLQDGKEIRAGLLSDIDDAEEDLKQDDYLAAYEKFREIGYFLRNDPIKVLRLLCLSRFILRSDMDLELSSLLPSRFDKDFIHYLHEVGRVRPQLIGKDVLDYCMKYRTVVREMAVGPGVLAAAAGAALRVREHLALYYDLILEQAEHLPKDRLLRLHRLLTESPGTYPELHAKVLEAAKQRFPSDAEFAPIL